MEQSQVDIMAVDDEAAFWDDRSDLLACLQRGDSLNVGYSHEFHRPQFVADVAARGFDLGAQWIDRVWQYGIFLFVRSD
jgi:L-histidine Nalpha-methyltransferase